MIMVICMSFMTKTHSNIYIYIGYSLLSSITVRDSLEWGIVTRNRGMNTVSPLIYIYIYSQGGAPQLVKLVVGLVGFVLDISTIRLVYMAVCQNLVPLVNIKIAGKWMFIPLKMVLIGIDPYPYEQTCDWRGTTLYPTWSYPHSPFVIDQFPDSDGSSPAVLLVKSTIYSIHMKHLIFYPHKMIS